MDIYNHKSSFLLIEGMGDIPATSTYRSVNALAKMLPSETKEAVYISDWSLYIFSLPHTTVNHNRRYFIYNQKNKIIQKVILHLEKDKADLSEISQKEVEAFSSMIRTGDLNKLADLTTQMKIIKDQIREISTWYHHIF